MQGSFLQTYEYTIAAGKIVRVWAYNKMLTILENSASNDIDVSVGGQPFTTFKKGLAYELPDGHDNIMIKNTAAVATTIEFCLSLGRVYDNRLIIADSELVVDNTSDAFDTPVALALNSGNSYKNSIAENTSRKELLIQNTGSNDFWFGNSDAAVDPATKRGIKVKPDLTYILTSTAAVYFESNSLDCTISIAEFTKS